MVGQQRRRVGALTALTALRYRGPVSSTRATLWLQPARERSLARRHPWIFSGGVARVDGSPDAGDTVLVRAADGTDEPLRDWDKRELASAICDRLAKLLAGRG